MSLSKDTILRANYAKSQPPKAFLEVEHGSAQVYALYNGNYDVLDLYKSLNKEHDRIDEQLKDDSLRRDYAKEEIARLNIIEKLLTPPYILSKPKETLWHQAIEDARSGRMNVYKNCKATSQVATELFSKDVIEKGHVFLVEHDWARAFKNADVTGEIRLPYEISIFEFIINDVRICSLVFHDGANTGATVVLAKTSVGWILLTGTEMNETEPFVTMEANVKAICIALDSEVAKSEIVRAPHKLNHARSKAGKLPIFDYHSVSLVRRIRPEPLNGTEPHEARWHPRLHWRRGHWRHFDNHKTWVRWTLVGDPDLGFVDKHYKL